MSIAYSITMSKAGYRQTAKEMTDQELASMSHKLAGKSDRLNRDLIEMNYMDRIQYAHREVCLEELTSRQQDGNASEILAGAVKSIKDSWPDYSDN